MQPAFSKIFFKCFKMFLCLKNKVNPSSLTYSDDDHVPKNSQNSFKKETFFYRLPRKVKLLSSKRGIKSLQKNSDFPIPISFQPSAV